MLLFPIILTKQDQFYSQTPYHFTKVDPFSSKIGGIGRIRKMAHKIKVGIERHYTDRVFDYRNQLFIDH